MDIGWLIVAAVGVVIAGGAITAARRPSIPACEARVFAAVNGLPDAWYRLFWFPMQLGNLWVGGATGLALALLEGARGAAVGILVVMAAKVPVETIVERSLGPYDDVRQRPGTSLPHAVRRGDVPIAGSSFPSGHVVLIASVASALAPVVPLVLLALLGLGTFLVMLGRVYVGAHNPLDVVAGLGAGLVVGGIVASAVA